MNMELMKNGLLLMVVGMGTVFAFLAIMVVTTTLASKVIAKFEHLLPEDEKPKRKSRKAVAPSGSGALLAVISAAIHKYRSEH
ncbi:MAG: OadG family protein [Lentisphaeria bacterium]|nr:OadG family protein [Lentisphaeria bacterium]